MIGILALQGAFAEHEAMLSRLGADCRLLKNPGDLDAPLTGLVLPGGESTVQGKLLTELSMLHSVREKILGGLPVMATCAGVILLAGDVDDEAGWLGTMPIRVRRNAYGRQLASFFHRGSVAGLAGNFTMHFIRAPKIVSASPDVKILAYVNEKIVAAQYKNQLALTFHPEVGEDSRLHEYFLQMVRTRR